MTLYKVEDYAFSKLRERYKKWTGNSFDNKDLISFGLADEGGRFLRYIDEMYDESDYCVDYIVIFR
ncbi:hypothetical protein OBE_01338 [human gut metagenome]|uniref:Uncharacterized protein n=1 Tax=human gut metagenome TaxID=408170 RepID=K1UB98_9ZZZZ